VTTTRPVDVASIVTSIRRLRALQSLSDDQVASLATAVRPELFTAGEVVYDEGIEGSDFHFVGSGEVEARRRTPFGDQKVAALGPGDLVGEISILDGGPRSSSVVGTRAGVLWRFDAAAVASLAAANPDLEVALLRVFCRSLAGKIRQANRVMSQIMAPGKSEESPGSGVRGQEGRVDEETKRRLLREHGMTTDDLPALAGFLAARRFASGERIFVEGEPGDTLYIVADGQVRISRRIPSLGEEALAILGPGEVFGEMAWIDSSPRSADAIAHAGGCTVLAISRQDLEGSIAGRTATTAQFLKTLCQVLCRRLRTMNDQLVAYRTIAWF
jgi:CRP/FNR family transcriptional regulator, cyclic AMP receptor protein